MKSTIHFLWLPLAFSLFLSGCTSEPKQEEGMEDTEAVAAEIKVYPLEGSQDFPTAQLAMGSMDVNETGEASFNFEVTDYSLGEQTPGVETLGLANSGQGQHIHLIVNNGPYTAHYEPSFSKQLEEGNNVILAFISRSYHESVKNPQSFVVTQIKVGEGDAAEADLGAPHMFYSRPKGTYKGKDTQKLLLDFFLVNTTLAPDGNKVRATINGEEFLFDSWEPYVVEGLPMGENTFRLELLDANGNLVPSPFNPVERTVMLEAEAM